MARYRTTDGVRRIDELIHPMTDKPPTTNNADALIQALAEEGQVDSTGAFSVDPNRAQELLESFRLADPPAFVLALLRVAVLGGATRLDAQITPRQVTLSFDGDPLSFEDLAEVASALPTPGESTGDQRRAALAEGIFAATALGATRMEISIDGPGGGALLERRQGRPDRLERRPEAPRGTRVSVDRRSEAPKEAGPGWEPPEADRLTERGRFAPLALEVNGRRVSEGPGLPNALFVGAVSGDRCSCVAGVEEEPHPARFCIVRHGAVIATDALETAPDGFVAVVEAPAVRRDLGLDRAVRDDAWKAVYSAVHQALASVLDQAWRTLALSGGRPTQESRALARRTIRTAYLAGAYRDEGLVQDLAVWPALGRRARLEHVSLAALRRPRKRSTGLFYITRWPDSLASGVRAYLTYPRGILLLGSPEEAERLGARLGLEPTCLDQAIAQAPSKFLSSLLGRLGELLDVGSVLLSVGLLFVLTATLFIVQSIREQHRWPGVPIQVQEAKIERGKKKSSKSSGKSATVFRVHLTYTYQSGARTFRRSENPYLELDTQAEAERRLERLRHPGFRAFTDPRNPARVILSRSSPWPVVLTGGIAMIVLLVSLASHLRGRARSVAEEAAKRAQAQVSALAEQLDRSHVGPKTGKRRRRRRR